MSDPVPDPSGRAPRPVPAADEEWAEAYAEGYGEGLREALREMLQHASRGHTAQELRLLVESRLARLKEDIDVKRKSLLGPPRRAAMGPMFRPSAPGPVPPSAPELKPASSYLVYEERPDRALQMLRAAASQFPRILVITFHPPDLSGVPADRVKVLLVGVPGAGGLSSDGSLSPQVLAGRIREAAAADGSVLVYVDALEVIATGSGGTEPMLRFVQWAAGEVARGRSALVVSVAPKSFDERTKSLLQRAFTRVV